MRNASVKNKMGELTNQVSNRADYFFYNTVFALTGRYDSPLLLADAVDLNWEGYGSCSTVTRCPLVIDAISAAQVVLLREHLLL